MSDTDEKKDKPYTKKMMDYLISILKVVLLIIIYYGLSGLIIYACKIAQSSVLPDNKRCFPYKDTKPTVEKITTDIFTTIFKSPQMSKKLEIPYDNYNSSNSTLDWIRTYKTSPDSYFLVNYLMAVLESTMYTNFSMFNTLFNKLNLLPESVLALLGPIIFGIASIIISFIDMIYIVYFWFAEMEWFFKYNTNDTGKGNANWKDVSMVFSGSKYMQSWFITILFTILFFFWGPILIHMYIIIVFLICIFNIFTFKSMLNGKPATGLTIIKETFIHYKVLITSVFTIIVVMKAFDQLGPAIAVVPVIIAGLIYLGALGVDVYTPVIEKGLTPVVNNAIANKTCNAVTTQNLKGLLSGWFGGGGGQSEKGLKKQLKELGKKLSKK